MTNSLQRHQYGAYAHKSCCELTDLGLGVVGIGNNSGAGKIYSSHGGSHKERKGYHTVRGFPGGLQLAGSQYLAHNYAVCHTNGHKGNGENIPEGLGDVEGGNAVQTAEGIALADKSHTGGPEELINKQGQTLYEKGAYTLGGNTEVSVKSGHKGVAFGFQVGEKKHDCKLGKAGNDGGYGCAANSESGSAEFAEDEYVVQNEVYKNGHYARRHRKGGLCPFAERAGVALDESEGNKTYKHREKITASCGHRGGRVGYTGVALHIKTEKGISEKGEKGNPEKGQSAAEEELEAEAMAHALVVFAAEILSAEYARACQRSEDAEIEDEEKLVGNGDARHLRSSHCADHNVIQHIHKVGDAVLDHHRHSKLYKARIQAFIPQKGVGKIRHRVFFSPLRIA